MSSYENTVTISRPPPYASGSSGGKSPLCVLPRLGLVTNARARIFGVTTAGPAHRDGVLFNTRIATAAAALNDSAFAKAGQNPDTATGEMATAGEVACSGGEVAFVRAIIRDSLRLRQRVRESKVCFCFFQGFGPVAFFAIATLLYGCARCVRPACFCSPLATAVYLYCRSL